MAAPRHLRLTDATLRGRLADLRNAVSPVLAGNFLPTFTDHSVEHSDRVCDLVDDLTAPLSQDAQLKDREAFVLYCAAYLHDAGLQHQRADKTEVVQKVLSERFPGRAWGDLELETRQEIVREQHHRISGEMITQSVNAPQPTVLGIQLTDDWNPGLIRSVAVAHNLYMDGADQAEYYELTRDWGGFRMSLLSALMRLADILDESRRRSRLYLEKTRELPLESQMHWWRHYYVADVQIEAATRHITLWFDFPPSHREQYRAMIPPLQVPYLQEEFARHAGVLARQNLLWHFRTELTPAAQSTAQKMDDVLERYILEKLASQREQQSERDRLLLLDQLQVARPTIERQLAQLRTPSATASPDQQLLGFRDLARHLSRLGGRRDAWTTLWSEYNRLAKSVGTDVKFDVATELAAMMLEDGAAEEAARLLHDLRTQADTLAPQTRFRFMRLLGRAYLQQCSYADGLQALTDAASLAQDRKVRDELTAEVDEARLLQGDLEELTHDRRNADGK